MWFHSGTCILAIAWNQAIFFSVWTQIAPGGLAQECASPIQDWARLAVVIFQLVALWSSQAVWSAAWKPRSLWTLLQSVKAKCNIRSFECKSQDELDTHEARLPWAGNAGTTSEAKRRCSSAKNWEVEAACKGLVPNSSACWVSISGSGTGASRMQSTQGCKGTLEPLPCWC